MPLLTIRLDRVVPFSPVIVWDALVDADLVAGWLGDARIEPVVGGRYDLAWLGTPEITATSGKITRLEQPTSLVVVTDAHGTLDFSLTEVPGGPRGTSTDSTGRHRAQLRSAGASCLARRARSARRAAAWAPGRLGHSGERPGIGCGRIGCCRERHLTGDAPDSRVTHERNRDWTMTITDSPRDSAFLAPAARALELIGGDLTEKSLRLHLEGLSGVDATGLEARAAALGTRSIKTTSKAWALDRIIGLIDLTTLEGADTPGKVRSLVAKAMVPDASDPSTPRVAAVCVYGDMVGDAVAALGAAHSAGKDDGINVAAVATAFPSGRASLAVKRADTAEAVAAGADEIDMVIDRGAFLSGRYGLVFDQIVAVKEACRRPDGTYAHLKVILETGELTTYDNVRRASWLAILAGGDFIKTSTGKESTNATLPVSLVMARAIRDFAQHTGFSVGFKPAGGISAAKDVLTYQFLMREELGRAWLEPSLFRVGASSLLADIERQLEHHVTGRYSAFHRHAIG